MAAADHLTQRLGIGVQLGLHEGAGPQLGQPALRWTDIRSTAEIADGVEAIDAMLVNDHLLVQNVPGIVEGEASIGAWDCWTVLAALAATTRRVQIASFVACALFRNPALIAKMADTLDEVSDGRFILALGAGYIESEFRAYGFSFDHRASRFEEALKILVPLLREGRVDFQGTYYQARQCELRPRGPTRGGPSLWIAGAGPRMCELVARYANGYTIYWQRTIEVIKEQYAHVDAACRSVGRDPATLLHSAYVPGSTVVPADSGASTIPTEESAARLLTLCETVGAQYLVMTVAGTAHLERLIPVIEELRRISTPQQTGLSEAITLGVH
jgi:alkanesulfonate monooxygenase SsuD/methylene tetrahydromethanopterin reductase-like flavin-dependent oxidoreductase (luciferase family)